MGLHCLLQCVYSSVILGNYLQQTTSAEIEMIFSDAFVLDVLRVNKITTKVVYICRLLKCFRSTRSDCSEQSDLDLHCLPLYFHYSNNNVIKTCNRRLKQLEFSDYVFTTL